MTIPQNGSVLSAALFWLGIGKATDSPGNASYVLRNNTSAKGVNHE